MGRAPCCDKANVKKGPWSPEEDAKLKSYIEQHGTGGNWIALPQKIGLKRCGKSCRLRWLNYLRPNIKHGGFTEEEENIICSLYISIGSRWSIIAAQLPGRTDNDIKNYWNTRLKKKLMAKQRQEQEMKMNQTPCRLPYWAENRLDMNMMMPVMNPNQDVLLGSHQDDHQLAMLLTKTRGRQFYNDPQILSNGVNYHYSSNTDTVQDQLYNYVDSINCTSGNYSHWPNTEYVVNGEGLIVNSQQGNLPDELVETYLSNNLLSFEGTESYSSVSVDVGNSSTTSTSPGSTSYGDMTSGLLVNTPVSDFDAYEKGFLHRVVQ